MEWNFLFKRDYWRKDKIRQRQYSVTNPVSTETRRATPLARTNSTGSPIVHVDHLVKKFGPDKIAVNDVSFDLYANQITSLLGPNGSGKTTIFNCLIGIYKQTSGTITMASEDGIAQDTRNEMDLLRQSIGYCPQHDILFDLLTIEEQLEFYAVARGFGKYKRQISAEMLNMVNLEQSKHTYCQALSGGMKRRLSLACAFVGDTKIILLDEVNIFLTVLPHWNNFLFVAIERSRSIESSLALGLVENDEGRQNAPSDHAFHGGE